MDPFRFRCVAARRTIGSRRLFDPAGASTDPRQPLTTASIFRRRRRRRCRRRLSILRRHLLDIHTVHLVLWPRRRRRRPSRRSRPILFEKMFFYPSLDSFFIVILTWPSSNGPLSSPLGGTTGPESHWRDCQTLYPPRVHLFQPRGLSDGHSTFLSSGWPIPFLPSREYAHSLSSLSRLNPPRLFLLFLYVSIEFGAVAPATRDFLRFFFFYRRQFRRLLSSYLIFFNRIFICKAPVSNNRKNRKFPLGIKTEYNEPSLSSWNDVIHTKDSSCQIYGGWQKRSILIHLYLYLLYKVV